MAQGRKPLRRPTRPYYLVPIMIGMAGVLFSSQLEDPILQGIVVLLCVAIPLFLGGNLLARIQSRGLQRYLLIGGMATLTIGAVVTVSGYSESLVENEMVPQGVGLLSRWLGVGSLLLGLLVVLYSLVRSEDIISELGERFRLVADRMGEGFVICDRGGRVVYVNRALLGLSGLSEDELLGRKALDLVKERGVMTTVRRPEMHAQGIAAEYQLAYTHNDQERHYLVAETAITGRRDERAGTLFTVRDVTRETALARELEAYAHRLEEMVEERTKQLQASKQRFQDLIISMNEGFLTIDESFRIRFVNDRILEMLGLNQDAIIGRQIMDFIEVGERERLKASLASAESRAASLESQDYTFMGSGKMRLSVKVSIAPVQEEEAGGRGFSLVVTDVSELKDAHAELAERAHELEKLNQELRELDRAKDVLLSNVSHELRTPLSTVQGYLEMWREGDFGKPDAQQEQALDVMTRNTERVATMINEMIEFSRMEIRGIHLYVTLFDLTRMLEECIESVAPELRKKSQRIVTQLPEETVYVWGDRPKLVQVINNLLANAVKFSHDGKEIDVRAEVGDSQNVTVSVTDQGIGIDAIHHEQIFEKFYQVDSSMSRRYQGTGVGLSIANNIVAAHGGRIALESTPLKGSSFRVHLPNAVFELETTPESDVDSLDIVLANSNTEFRGAVAKMLTGLGHRVRQAAGGHECLRAVREHGCDLVILDDAFGDLSGHDVLDKLRTDSRSQDVPAILLSSEDGLGAGRRAVRLLPCVRLEKPFTAKQFVESIQQAVGRQPTTA